jgi:hypothetical protein
VAKQPAKEPAKEPAAALIDIADTLYRAAVSSCNEHHKFAELVERGAPETDQRQARAAVRGSDEILDEAADLYELACLEESNHADDAWWHRANMVWRGAKEYLRHRASSNRLTRGGNGRAKTGIVEISIEFELEASALLGLRHALDSYRMARPEADKRSLTA